MGTLENLFFSIMITEDLLPSQHFKGQLELVNLPYHTSLEQAGSSYTG